MFGKKKESKIVEEINPIEYHIKNIELLSDNNVAIINYLRILTDNIQCQQLGYCFGFIKNDLNLDEHEINIPRAQHYLEALGDSQNMKIYDSKEYDIEVDLAIDPIISCIWDTMRVRNALDTIGDGCIDTFYGKENTFKYDPLNHYVTHIYPLGVNIVTNGNHSIFSGIIKRKGKVKVTSVLDISERLNHLHYDSKGAIIDGNHVTSIPLQTIKELAIIYEIGRLRKEQKREYIYPKIGEFIKKKRSY